MGSRKDILKRTLGITEYPWSSGDELEEAPSNTETTRGRRPATEAQPSSTDAPGPSNNQASPPGATPPHGAARAPSQVHTQRAEARRQARHDRNLFWSIINSPHRISNLNQPARNRASDGRGSARALPASDEMWLRARDGAQRTRDDMQRLTDFKRITLNLRNRASAPAPRANPGVAVPTEPSSRVLNRHLRRFVRPTTRTANRPSVSWNLTGADIAVGESARGSDRPRERTNWNLPTGDITVGESARGSDRPRERTNWNLPTGDITVGESARGSDRSRERTNWNMAAGDMALGESARSSVVSTDVTLGDTESERPQMRSARTSTEPELRRALRWVRHLSAIQESSATSQQAEDELNNNPSTSVAAEPEPMDETNDDTLSPIVVMGDELDVDAMENTGGNVTLEEEIVAIDLESSDLAPAGEVTSAPITVSDQTDGRFAADARRHAAGGDAGTSNNLNTSGEPWPDPEQQRESRKRRNSNEHPEPSSVKEFNKSVLRLLECPVCLEWMEPPMSQCRRGHLVCAACRARLASCPVCRTTFSSVRNRAMEGVAELLRYPCRHGCGKEVRLRRRAPHESSCAARKYACPAPACHAAPLALASLQAHFQSQHLSMLKLGCQHKLSIKLSTEQHDTWLVMAMEQYFHLRLDVDSRRAQGIVVFVAYIGPKCDAKNYTYEVTIDGQHNQRKLLYARTTHSDLESSTFIVNRHDCFHLTHDQALNFTRAKNRRCDGDKYLDISLQISKIERQIEPLEDSDS